MNDFDSRAQESLKEDWPVEVSDLDLPRAQRLAIPAWVRPLVQRWRTPRARQRLRKLSNVGLALVILLIILLLSGNNFFSLVASQLRTGFGLFPQTTPPANSLFTLDLSPTFKKVHGQDGIACLLDAQWSPTGDAIAVLGYQYNCPSNHDMPGILNIYNARTGKLSAQWQPDDTIIHIMNAPTVETIGNKSEPTFGILATSSFKTTNAATANIGHTRLLPFSYIHVMWSPDGQWLAMSFIVYMQQRPFFGVLEMKVNGHSAHIIFQPPNLNQQMPIEWNFETGQALGFTPLQPAIGYHWGARGALIPDMPLSGRPQQPVQLSGPVGNPDGNAAFTIWQPGSTTFTAIAGYYGWSTTFSAWSPDGHYLVDDINLRGFYKPPGSIIPDIQALSKLKLRHNRALSPRNDAVFEDFNGSPVLGWRPDGRLLATYFARGYILLYDSRTGRAIQTFQLSSSQRLLAGNVALLRWSPDGSHLLLASATNGLLNIWGPDQLPQV